MLLCLYPLSALQEGPWYLVERKNSFANYDGKMLDKTQFRAGFSSFVLKENLLKLSIKFQFFSGKMIM